MTHITLWSIRGTWWGYPRNWGNLVNWLILILRSDRCYSLYGWMLILSSSMTQWIWSFLHPLTPKQTNAAPHNTQLSSANTELTAFKHHWQKKLGYIFKDIINTETQQY